jgi:HAD-superfamily hydrolase, subfamily IIB
MIRNLQKTLYISDLDGTLLNRDAELSKYTTDILNKLILSGVSFSVATARTAATAVLMLDKVKVNVPIVLMNGVLIYDIQAQKYVKTEPLEKEKSSKIISAMERTGQSGFMYTFSNDRLSTYYERIENEAMKAFEEGRLRKYGKRFVQVSNFEDCSENAIYFCFMSDCDNINRFHEEIKDISGLRIEKYQDNYSDDIWYMEVFSDRASKYNSVQFLRREYGFDKVVGFGDNLNDLPLFAACDECYAVSNAKAEVKERATAVIGSNYDDGVARWLWKHLGDE